MSKNNSIKADNFILTDDDLYEIFEIISNSVSEYYNINFIVNLFSLKLNAVIF